VTTSTRVPTTLGRVTVEAEQRLAAAGVLTPRVDARWLVMHACGVDPWRFPDAWVDAEAARRLDDVLRRRVAREPLQLVVGDTGFCDLTVRCRAGVFVPRPETEVLAMRAVEAANRHDAPLIVEPCTGSGAVAAVLLAHVPGAHVVATDVDPAAVALAEENLARVRAGTSGRPAARGASAQVRLGDLLTPVPPDLRGHVDVLVANPPYLPVSDARQWEPEVHHDPPTALVGGPDGHEVVDRLLAEAGSWLAPGGTLLVEIDARRAPAALKQATTAGLLDAQLVDDLTGAPRVLRARMPDPSVPNRARADRGVRS
jgi:release factor glutamine methyltransferase